MSGRDVLTWYSAHSSIVDSETGTPNANGSPDGGFDSELEREPRGALCNNAGATVAAKGVGSGAVASNEWKPAAGDVNAGGPPMITFFISTSLLRRLPFDRECRWEGAKEPGCSPTLLETIQKTPHDQRRVEERRKSEA